VAELGLTALMLGLGLSAYAAIGSLIGQIRGVPELVVSARRALYLSALSAVSAALALMTAFMQNDFSLQYVVAHSNTVLERGFTFVAFYAGNEGSLLYILMVLALMSVAAIVWAPKRFARSMPYTIAILAGTQFFYFMVLIFFASPFEAVVGDIPTEGMGLNPLLQHPGMYSHPPIIMAGLVGITIPFAYATGALISGNYGDDWIDIARVSGIIVWGVLGLGLLIGAWWAYTILGWGGYWSWDPIENVAFMPWLVMTAFIHSIMVQKRRGMFRMWNVALLNIAFVLAQLGMFINRGGPVVSVHSFAASSLGVVFVTFMFISLIFAFGVFLWRYPQLKSDRAVESFLSREASFLVNNFLLLAVVAVTLWGVIFPVLSDLARDVSVSISAPYFNRVNGPLLLAMVVIMGVGPLLPWRRVSARSLRTWFIWPTAGALVVVVGLFASGISVWVAVVAFGCVAFVAVAIAEEWWRGTAARHRGGDSWPMAYWNLISGNRPRHGGYIVHIAILTLSIGIIGTQFFDQREDVALMPGESAVIDDYRVEFVGTINGARADRTTTEAELNIFRINRSEYDLDAAGYRIDKNKYLITGVKYPGDKYLETVGAWQAFYPAFNQVSVRSGIRSTLVEDLYLIPSNFNMDGSVALRMSINPLAMWLWISAPIFLLGTVVALWPAPALERRTVGSRKAVPAGAKTGQQQAVMSTSTTSSERKPLV
jgi:cytochrome c-type biogenesis protein CcmF